MKVKCGCCDWEGTNGECFAIEDIYERVDPGEPMPAGECPECGSLVHPETETRQELMAAACTQLIRAYAMGEERGGSIDWEDINAAYALALRCFP